MHGESAYPATAWVEYQYVKNAQDLNIADNVPVNMGSDGLGSRITMGGMKEDKSEQSYNNPFEMIPTTGKLFKQMSATFLSLTAKGEDEEGDQTKDADAHENKAYM